jgi:hypothetical protein
MGYYITNILLAKLSINRFTHLEDAVKRKRHPLYKKNIFILFELKVSKGFNRAVAIRGLF